MDVSRLSYLEDPQLDPALTVRSQCFTEQSSTNPVSVIQRPTSFQLTYLALYLRLECVSHASLASRVYFFLPMMDRSKDEPTGIHEAFDFCR